MSFCEYGSNYLEKNTKISVGIDIGSTTTKVLATVSVEEVEGRVSDQILCKDYWRHQARQRDSLRKALSMLREKLSDRPFCLVLTGSGAEPLAKELGVPFLQEVVASAIALGAELPGTGTAIELGGQDAKILFFKEDDGSGLMQVRDMRMNGVCAGGTGAFLDEVSEILHIPVEEYSAAAERGSTVYDISGRCGVFAKTDLQPLLNQGADKDDLALSAYYAIVRQTIGGLARGMQIQAPVAFFGGVLNFHPRLIQAFAEKLGLEPEEVLIPAHPESFVARGAAASCQEMFSETPVVTADALLQRMEDAGEKDEARSSGPLYFRDEAERADFYARHVRPKTVIRDLPQSGESLEGYLGIDAGSTTTKFVLMDREGKIRWSFYGNNGGDPLKVAVAALKEMRDTFREHGVSLKIRQAASTGYGETLFHRAFRTDTHLVETVAHASAAVHYAGDVTFLLDIGGQDMKIIWITKGVIRDIVINEACSSGCGSFLENFAASLHIPKEKIAEAAFSSEHPAVLGSRCTVFMNSSIITEQRNGSTPADIMAGLCRSIIENVFVKVIRMGNLGALGDRIMVQGGTFLNDAVLRAMEQYVGRPVLRAPYPGLMGAIGAALEAKEYEKTGSATDSSSRFLSMEELDSFSYTQETGVSCPFCSNHCQRTVLHFSTGGAWVTGNRCERGVSLEEPAQVSEQKQAAAVPDLYRLRRQLLFRDTGVQPAGLTRATDKERRIAAIGAPAAIDASAAKGAPAAESRGITIGIPRVLLFWDTYPFWDAFWKSLGFSVLLSPESTRKIYEDGLTAVASDTECLPAKLVHGHVRWLEAHGADRIFMPAITAVPSENTAKSSESMCALVKGYPLVMQNADDPGKRSAIPLDAPLFHWHTDKDRRTQLQRFMKDTFGITGKDTEQAIRRGDLAQDIYRQELMDAGRKVLEGLGEEEFAVVLGGRPYHNDPLVNHELPRMFTEMGIPVITADALREIYETDLSRMRLDAVNNFHSRMLSSAILAAFNQQLEYAHISSFGCGHEAYLVDEIDRLMREISGKTPLTLKVDESEATGPLRIRVRSFVESIRRRRRREQELAGRAGRTQDRAEDRTRDRAESRNQDRAASRNQRQAGQGTVQQPDRLPDPYPVKFLKEDKKIRTLLCPNTSHGFSRLMAATLEGLGIKTVALPVGRENAIRLGKRYVHNDMCFPAQIVIGEALEALQSGKYDPDRTAVGMARYVGDCRLTHYSAVLRKALDDAGFPQVPIWTNDLEDAHNLHPGMKLDLITSIKTAIALPMMDALEDLLRKTRPYEIEPGGADRAFDTAMDQMLDGMRRRGLPGLRSGFAKAIDTMKNVKYDRTVQRPQVVIVGEFLLNFHPGANHDIERYLEKYGFEIVEAKMADVIQKSYYYQREQVKKYKIQRSIPDRAYLETAEWVFGMAHHIVDSIASAHPLYEHIPSLPELAEYSEPILPGSFDTGEGILIPAEIIYHAQHGCRNFIILQPFGCLPNHVVGRGLIHKLQEMFPDVRILALDFDPDVSFANIENRLQMMINDEKLLRGRR